MKKIFPIIRPEVKVSDIFHGFLRGKNNSQEGFAAFLAKLTGKKYVYLVNSGLTAFYLALIALKLRSERKEVVLPAYTAGSLVVAIKKAGLKPVLCDIALEDFNIDRKSLPEVISQDTLAVAAVHMFGIPINDISGLKDRIPSKICLIEDCAQAQGAKVDNLAVGRFGEISFFSFNRGKNFSLFGGGGITTDNQVLAEEIGNNVQLLKKSGKFSDLFPALKMCFSLFAVNPYIYGCANFLISRFKENAPPGDLKAGCFSGLHAGLGMFLAESRDKFFSRRNHNGEYLRERLKSVPGIRLAGIAVNCYPVYNRFPVLFEDLKVLEKKQLQLWKAGFESSRMYLKPLHQMFDFGYQPLDFPNAGYFAEHALTLPVYSSLGKKELDKIIEVIKK